MLIIFFVRMSEKSRYVSSKQKMAERYQKTIAETQCMNMWRTLIGKILHPHGIVQLDFITIEERISPWENLTFSGDSVVGVEHKSGKD